MADRPLPPAVGATENALRALLAEVIADGPIGGYAEWIFLNVIDRGGDPADLDQRVASVLGQHRDVAAAVRARLVGAGLIGSDGVLTEAGHEQLLRARTKVAEVTAVLTAGIDPGALAITMDTLDTVRTRAEGLLAR